MAFKRYANALTAERNIHFDKWVEELRAQASDAIPEKRVIKTAKEVLTRCDPKQYLLSHATIVASVDTYTPRLANMGKGFDERGMEIDVRFADFRIKPECTDIINNNGDAWERSLLMSTYKTFVGAPNYLEHIQLPALSKGFIVDAIARDLGNSCYIDILVATDRRHNQLVNDILSGEMQAMSMGCISLFTMCSRCGNVAVDDSQICSHVAYDGKLTAYTDEDGVEHRLGELIGHVTVPNSNQFIEASWVRNPAFKGAVRRNLLNADHVANNTQFAAKFDNSSNVAEFRNGMEFDVPVRAASIQVPARKYLPSLLRIAEELSDNASLDEEPDDEGGSSDLDADLDIDLDAGGGSDDSGSDDSGSDAPVEEPDSKNKIQELADKVREQVLEIVVNDLDEILQPDAEDVGTASPPSSVHSLNDNILSTTDYGKLLKRNFSSHPELVEWATSIYRSIHKSYANRGKVLSSLSPTDLIKFSWINDVVSSKRYPPELYQTVMAVGPVKGYPSRKSFLAACSIHLKRSTNEKEKEFLIRKGRIASQSNTF